MKKLIILFLILSVMTTGCSYTITTKNGQALKGENENWKAEYKINFTTTYPKKDGDIYVNRMEAGKLTVTYKKALSDLAGAKHMEISYTDSFGNGGSRTEDYDSPPTGKQFRLGNGISSITEKLGDYLATPENLHKAIMIYSGPSYEMRANASATVKIQIDGKTQIIHLLPAQNAAPNPIDLEQIINKLKTRPLISYVTDRFPDLSLKLVKSSASVVKDKAISGSTIITEGDKKGQEFVPTVVYYEFTMRNEGSRIVTYKANDLQAKIVPNEKLKEVLKETVGINIFEPDIPGVGHGQTIAGDLFNSHKDCILTLSFDLDASEESPLASLATPSEDKVEKIRLHALDASLIILYKDQEIARFDLN